jgi:Methyltransferase domain
MIDAVDRSATLTPARALLANLPKLHYWGGEEQVGGLNSTIGERMITELGRYQAPRVVETGAGATTLLFCCLDPGAVTSIAPSDELHDRILAEAAAREIAVDRLRYLCERSEVALPRIAADGDRFDAGLIDGCHNWPSVLVDFCYINMMLPAGGTLFLDDVHLYSVSQLYLLLQQQNEFEYVALDDKLATFRKLVDHPFLPEWNFEPYIKENSPVQTPP